MGTRGGEVGSKDIGIPVHFRLAFSIVYCFVAWGSANL